MIGKCSSRKGSSVRLNPVVAALDHDRHPTLQDRDVAERLVQPPPIRMIQPRSKQNLTAPSSFTVYATPKAAPLWLAAMATI